MIPDPIHEVLAPGNWPTFVYLSARVGGFMVSAPLWSMMSIPRTLQAGIVVLLSMLLLPIARTVIVPNEVLLLPVPMALEFIMGLVIGLSAAVIVQGVTMAGEVLSHQMGLALGPAMSPMPDVQMSGIGQLKGFLALAIYVGVGGHLVLLQGLAESVRTLPPGCAPGLQNGGGIVASLLQTLCSTAVRTAAPVMVALLVTNVALGILTRAVPQLNAMMVALPLSAAAGLVTLGLAFPVISHSITNWMGRLPEVVAEILQAFRATVTGN